MPDYSQGKIYTIRCKVNTFLIYVGSTTQSLSQRWGGHKKDSLRKPQIILYTNIKNDWDNWYIELYEKFPCGSKEELMKKEGEIIRLIGNLNKNVAGRTMKEYDEERKTNPERIHQKKEIGIKYRAEKADEIKINKKEYFQKNSEKIKKDRSIKVKCECGCEVSKGNLGEHRKSVKHHKIMASINSTES